ncbi:MAG: prephenate dehydrogenase [Actinomycetaceae bacterium]|nr:prephenate dehydrogenase [Actinomycetaceae bacterium]
MTEHVQTVGPVLVIGSGLLGASIGLRLRASGVEVYLEDTSPTSLQLASDIGAGTPFKLSSSREDKGIKADDVAMVIVATPPDVAGAVVVDALERFPRAHVTDVASVKVSVENEVVLSERSERYVGSHPMAGKEKSGAGKADADLFEGRPWVLVAHDKTAPETLRAVRTVAIDVGATPIELGSDLHDESVALVSHVPQLVSSVLAAQLHDAPAEALQLSGQGLRDTTRIAHSDPRLWTAIIAGNKHKIAQALNNIADELRELSDACAGEGVVGAVYQAMQRGNEGAARIPGKHGGAPRRYAAVDVLVPDKPGFLGRLFSDVGDIGVNIEDFRLEHSRYGKQGIATLSVEPRMAQTVKQGLEQRDWTIVVWE